MKQVRRRSLIEQTAAHLREGIRSGRWVGKLPGVRALADECAVSHETMRPALALLETEGLVRNQGAGRARLACPETAGKARGRRVLRVMILLGKGLAQEDGDFQQILMLLQRDLEAAGHVCRFTDKSQSGLHHNLGRIKSHVAEYRADAWIVVGGNREILTWFSRQAMPVMALCGHCIGLPIAGTGMDERPGFRTAIRHLIELGHRRIVLLWPGGYGKAQPGGQVMILTEELAAYGVKVTSYHLPDFKETPDGLRDTLEKTFRLTPPTAIITCHSNWMAGVLSFLAERGLHAPRDISLICMGPEIWLSWQRPEIARLQGDQALMVRRIVRWANAVARGRTIRDCVLIPEEFVAGGTIGPARG